MRKATKTIISFAVVLIAGLNFFVPAFAQDPFSSIAIGGLGGISGAGLFSSMAGMSGVNLDWTGQTSDPMDAMWNVLNPDHVYFSGEKHEATNIDEDIYDYINVDIGDWLEAQSNFISEFCQQYSVTDNSSGSVHVDRSFYGYNFSTTVSSGTYIGAQIGVTPQNVQIGPFSVSVVNTGNNYQITTYYEGTEVGTAKTLNISYTGYPIYLRYNNGTVQFVYLRNGSYLAYGNAYSTSINNPTNVGWTSTDVDTNVFDGWESAKVKIPSSISQLQQGWTVSDFMNELNRLWENNLEVNVVIENNDEPDPPVPPIPVPSTPLGDVGFDEFVDLWGTTITNNQNTANDKLDFIGSNGEDQLEELENVNTALADLNDTANHIDAGVVYILQDTDSIDTNVGSIEGYTENIDTNIDSLVDTADNIDTNITSIESLTGSIDTNIDDIADTAESIDTNIGIGNGLLGGIRSLAQSAVNYLEGIAEHVAELVEEIVEGTETLIAGILNQIPQAFGVIFGPIKQASSIWHYVVEWITSIGAPFQFIWSMASGTSYYVILPVYASLAAAVVLAFFKRFGR